MLSTCRGSPPTPRSDHAAAVHAERYLLIFGGGSHATCFDDLHVLDLQTVCQASFVLATFFVGILTDSVPFYSWSGQDIHNKVKHQLHVLDTLVWLLGKIGILLVVEITKVVCFYTFPSKISFFSLRFDLCMCCSLCYILELFLVKKLDSCFVFFVQCD